MVTLAVEELYADAVQDVFRATLNSLCSALIFGGVGIICPRPNCRPVDIPGPIPKNSSKKSLSTNSLSPKMRQKIVNQFLIQELRNSYGWS